MNKLLNSIIKIGPTILTIMNVGGLGYIYYSNFNFNILSIYKIILKETATDKESMASER